MNFTTLNSHSALFFRLIFIDLLTTTSLEDYEKKLFKKIIEGNTEGDMLVREGLQYFFLQEEIHFKNKLQKSSTKEGSSSSISPQQFAYYKCLKVVQKVLNKEIIV